MDLLPHADETLDRILSGNVRLLQAKSGYRTAIDAPLLAWFAAHQLPGAKRALDLGAGSGLVSIVLAKALPHVQLQLLEKQPTMVQRARRNALLNGVAERLGVVEGDVADPPPLVGPFDLVLCNPPYMKRDHGHPPTNPERQIAHQETSATLRQFCQVAARVMSSTAYSCWIFPWHDAPRLLDDLAAVGLGDRAVMRVVHRPNDLKANRILVRAGFGPAQITELESRAIHLQDQPDRVFQPDLARFFASLAESPVP